MKRKFRAYYGIDAPRILKICGFLMMILICAMFFIMYWLYAKYPLAVSFIVLSLCIATVFLLYPIFTILIGSFFLKYRDRDWLLDVADIKGDERVLDVGCGRGLLLIGAARRLKTGKAIGIDIWCAADQTANSPDATLCNAEIEGVLDKVKVVTADARNMPFDSSSFDIVISSWVLHNISTQRERQKALSEIARVIRPGGIVAIMDIEACDEYEDFFKQHRFEKITRIGPRYTFGTSTYIIKAVKPTVIEAARF